MIRNIFTFIALLLIPLASVNAQEIFVQAETKFKPQKAIGLIFDQKESISHKETSIEILGDDKYLVKFTPEEIPENAFASAILIGESGESAFATVRDLNIKLSSNFLKLPECRLKNNGNYSQQIEILKELINIRTQLRDVYKRKFAELLSPDIVEKITKLEKEYGFSEGQEISTNIPPEELNLRLFRLLNAVKNNKGK